MPRIDYEPKLDFKDVLLRPKRSTLKSRADVDLERKYDFRNSKQSYAGIPVVASNMDTVGTFEMARSLGGMSLFTCIHKHYTVDEWTRFRAQCLTAVDDPVGYTCTFFAHVPDLLQTLRHTAISTGSNESDFTKLRQIVDAVPEINYICVDVANGYSEHFVNFIRRVREAYARHTIMAGNVVTGEMVEELILTGADVIKVGIGPGSVCTTRNKAGVGYPQLSAVLECADAAHGLGGHIMSDGGCTCPGDVAKAFGAGADFVMAGGIFAGYDECGGETIERNGQKFKLFYGMSSDTAMKKHHGSVAEYRASEGKTILKPYRGPVAACVLDVLGGLRSACTYTGARTLRELPKRATFIRVTQQTNESLSAYNLPQDAAVTPTAAPTAKMMKMNNDDQFCT